MTYEEADNIASTIRIGGLNVELEEISSEVVGAQLGQEAVSTSLLAGAIGLAIVCIFMMRCISAPGIRIQSCPSDLYRSDSRASERI